MVQMVENEVKPVRGARLWPMSVEAYHVLGEAGVIPENTELLYGLVYTKMPKSPLHSFLVRRLFDMLRSIETRGFLVRSEQPLTFNDSEPEPDIAVVRGSMNEFRTDHPRTAEVVIEVCVTSYEFDLSKLRAYAQAGVKECWLVLAEERFIEVHSEPKAGGYSIVTKHGPGGALQTRAIPNFSVALDALFQA
jgi:Uma2 family endonuclease